MSMNDCPICGAEETVTHHEGVNDSEYKNGHFKGLILEYSKCSVCGSEFASPGQINRNAQRARERMEEVKQKCGCGRSLSGYCDGSHSVTNEECMKKLDEAKKKALTENTQQLLKE